MRSLFLISTLGLLFVSTASAHAQSRDADMRNRFGVKLLFGFGGEAEYDGDVSVNAPIIGPIGGRGNFDDDMETSAGLGLSFEAPFHQYMTAGGIVELVSWNNDAREDNNVDNYTLLGLDGFFKVRIPVSLGSMDFEPYAMIPLGISVNFPGDDDDDRIDTGFGWNTGLLLGGILFLGETIGLNAELGYRGHNVTHNVDDDGRGDFDFDISTGQAVINLGVVIALD